MTAPTYPRIAEHDACLVVTSPSDSFVCLDALEAQLALNALSAAFNAGMRHMLDQMKEKSDEADA